MEEKEIYINKTNNKMKTNCFTLAALALAFALAGCTQDELTDNNRLPEGEYPVVIRATGLSVTATPQAAPSTRATVDGDWQGVRTVAVAIGDEVKKYTVTSDAADNTRATLSRENDPFWWTSREDITASAWWPYDADDITRMPAVVVLEDQSTLAAFQGSDFISAENRTVEFDNPTLEFTHRTARVAIELKPGTGITSVDGATVSLVSLSADNGNPTAIKTCNTSGNTHEALTAPQTVAAGKPFIYVELGGATFCFYPQDDVVLEAGNRYTYTITVKADGIEVTTATGGEWNDSGNSENVESSTAYKADDLKAGDYYYSDGTWSDGGLRKLYPDGTMEWTESKPAGHHANDGSDYSSTGIGSEKCHGYAVALTDATSSHCMWGVNGTELGCYPTDGSGNGQDNWSNPDIDWNGYAWTQKIITQGAGGVENLNATEQAGYPATWYAVVDYEGKFNAPANSSGWFLPSIGQMWNVYQNRSSLFDDKTGVSGLQSDRYWSSSEYYYYPANYALYVYVLNDRVYYYYKNVSICSVRAVLAF